MAQSPARMLRSVARSRGIREAVEDVEVLVRREVAFGPGFFPRRL